MSTEAMEFLNTNSGGSGNPAVKFPTIGSSIKGVIVGTPRVVTTPSLDTGEPEKKLVIELCDDNGELWALWVKAGWMATAVRDAVTKAGATGLLEGGTLVVKYSADGEQKKAGLNPPKIYEAAYKPPAPTGVNVDDLLG